MKQLRIIMLVVTLALLVMLSASVLAVAAETLKAELQGFEEVPAISTTGSGEFRGKISSDETSIEYELSYANLTGTAFVAHIHLGQRGVNGGVIAFLCGGEGKPACPPSGMVTGTVTASDVIGPAGQGIAPGEFDELLQAIRQGVTYANVHTNLFPGGEIRGQIKGSSR